MYRELTAMDIRSLYPGWEMAKLPNKQKENNMVKDFMVVHAPTMGKEVMLIRKAAITAVYSETTLDEDTICCIRADECVFRVSESYAEVVKRLFE